MSVINEAQHDKPAQSKLITVFIDTVEKMIEMGKYTTEQLIQVLGVTPGYVLNVKDGNSPLKPLTPGATYQVHPGMQFFSQPPDGTWS